MTSSKVDERQEVLKGYEALDPARRAIFRTILNLVVDLLITTAQKSGEKSRGDLS